MQQAFKRRLNGTKMIMKLEKKLPMSKNVLSLHYKIYYNPDNVLIVKSYVKVKRKINVFKNYNIETVFV